jgi:hypothetical protein
MSFTPFQNLLPKAANSYGIAKELKAIQICREFEKMLPGLFENRNADQTQRSKPIEIPPSLRAKFYKKNILYISTPSSVWASEIMMRKHKILEDLSQKFRGRFGRPLVKDLKTLTS